MNPTLISMMKSLDKGNDVFLKICCLLWSKFCEITIIDISM